MVLLILSCSKRSVLKSFPSTRKLKAGVFKFLRFEERFRKAPFRDGLLWTAGLTVEIKLYAFLNFSGVVWTESGANHNVNEHYQTKRLMSKTKAVQVCSVNLCTFHSHPLQNSDAKWPRTRKMIRTTDFSYFHLELNAVITYLA